MVEVNGTRHLARALVIQADDVLGCIRVLNIVETFPVHRQRLHVESPQVRRQFALEVPGATIKGMTAVHPSSDGLQPTSDGLKPASDGLHPWPPT